jgi:hypothetical protein
MLAFGVIERSARKMAAPFRPGAAGATEKRHLSTAATDSGVALPLGAS